MDETLKRLIRRAWEYGFVAFDKMEEKHSVETFIEKHKKQLKLYNVRRSYTIDEVREIALEYRNTSLYGHSHKLTRSELKNELSKIDKKHNLEYKEGVDYRFE